jgi:hypothetical protein
MRKRIPPGRWLLPLLLGFFTAGTLNAQAPTDSANRHCTSTSWRRVLALGLETDGESARRLAKLRDTDPCPDHRKLAEILLNDRELAAEELEKPVLVRSSNLDWSRLKLGCMVVSQLAILKVSIDADGRVADVQVARPGVAKIDELCVETVRSWLYRPLERRVVISPARAL